MIRRSAEVRLADVLSDADSVEGTSFDRATGMLRFSIARAGEAYSVNAAVAADGAVTGVEVRDVGRGAPSIGPLSWLADVMHEVTAVVRVEVDDEGLVTLTTDDGLRYLCNAGHDSRTNNAVSARWGAEWNAS
jgi:hypothetical protein